MTATDAFLQALGIANKHTDQSIEGYGVQAGKNCQIASTQAIEGGVRVTFAWYDDEGIRKSNYIDVMNGAKGEDGAAGEQGPKGDRGRDGEDGKDGQDGKSFDIKAQYASYEDLVAAHPTGSAGDAYFVGIDNNPDLYIWLTEDNEWYNNGPIAGVKGDKGDPGEDAVLENDVVANTQVGAISSGTTIYKDTTFTEFVNKLLVSEIAPTLTFSISKSGNVLYGGSYTETLTVNVSNLGTAKKIKKIDWYEGNVLKQSDTIDAGTGTYTYTMLTPTTDTTTFKAIVHYVKSNDTEASITKTAEIKFFYNKFYGGVSSLTPDEATVEALSTALATSKGGTYTFNVSDGRICYAYPKSLGALASIKDGNGFSLFDSFTRTEQTYTQNGTSVAYYRYVLTDATTVSSYNVTFG